jgi:hypothetical protein
MPLDAACLSLVCTGARMVVNAAFALVPDRNNRADGMLSELIELDKACQKVYKDRGVADTAEALQGRKTQYTGWTTLASIARGELPVTSARLASCGFELALKLTAIDRKVVADVHMTDLTTGHPEHDLESVALVKGIYFDNMGLAELIPWFKRAKKNYFKFISTFSATPPPPPPPTVHERAVAQWRAHAVYTNFKQRAAVLDKSTLSELQIQHCVHRATNAKFQERSGFMASLWFDGFAGLNFGSLADIPLSAECDGWVICIDMETGLLKRDLSCMAPTMAKPARTGYCIPTTLLFSTPLPQPVFDFLAARLRDFPNAATLGDLMPELLQIESSERLYQTPGDISPTRARWTRTPRRYMRRNGEDNLITSTMTGDFGNTGKSKLHYCAVSHEELWDACRRVYQLLNFGDPVAMPGGLLHFGSPLVSTHDHVMTLDQANLDKLEKVRVTGKCSPEKLIEFHNAYVIALGFRLCCLLALRRANPLDISANLEEDFDRSIDIDDKGSPGRPGALPVPMASHVKQLIRLYRAHCKAMSQRLTGQRGYTHVFKWLDAVVQHQDVQLLCSVSSQTKKAVPVSTATVLTDEDEIARDFGLWVVRRLIDRFFKPCRMGSIGL